MTGNPVRQSQEPLEPGFLRLPKLLDLLERVSATDHGDDEEVVQSVQPGAGDSGVGQVGEELGEGGRGRGDGKPSGCRSLYDRDLSPARFNP